MNAGNDNLIRFKEFLRELEEKRENTNGVVLKVNNVAFGWVLAITEKTEAQNASPFASRSFLNIFQWNVFSNADEEYILTIREIVT